MGTHCCSTKEQEQSRGLSNQGRNINTNNSNNTVSLPSKSSSFNKALSKSIANNLPTRTQIDFHSFKDLLKNKTNNLSQIEKSYVSKKDLKNIK